MEGENKNSKFTTQHYSVVSNSNPIGNLLNSPKKLINEEVNNVGQINNSENTFQDVNVIEEINQKMFKDDVNDTNSNYYLDCLTGTFNQDGKEKKSSEKVNSQHNSILLVASEVNLSNSPRFTKSNESPEKQSCHQTLTSNKNLELNNEVITALTLKIPDNYDDESDENKESQNELDSPTFDQMNSRVQNQNIDVQNANRVIIPVQVNSDDHQDNTDNIIQVEPAQSEIGDQDEAGNITKNSDADITAKELNPSERDSRQSNNSNHDSVKANLTKALSEKSLKSEKQVNLEERERICQPQDDKEYNIEKQQEIYLNKTNNELLKIFESNDAILINEESNLYQSKNQSLQIPCNSNFKDLNLTNNDHILEINSQDDSNSPANQSKLNEVQCESKDTQNLKECKEFVLNDSRSLLIEDSLQNSKNQDEIRNISEATFINVIQPESEENNEASILLAEAELVKI